MMSIKLSSPSVMKLNISSLAKEKRLYLNFSQKTLSERSRVSLGTIKKFEKTGKISLESLLKIALVLDDLKNFINLFSVPSISNPKSIADILTSSKIRKRGRK